MHKCWRVLDDMRPTFADLGMEMENIIKETKHRTGPQRRDIVNTYVNLDLSAQCHYTNDFEVVRENATAAAVAAVAAETRADLMGASVERHIDCEADPFIPSNPTENIT